MGETRNHAGQLSRCYAAFQVFDAPSSVAFYRDMLDFEVVSTSKPFDEKAENYGWAMLRRDTVSLMVNNMYENNIRPNQPDALRAQAHRDTVLYIGCRQLEDIVMNLRSQGASVRGPVTTYYGMLQVLVRDADGYSLCFQRPTDLD
jgi:glyoxylase I family protein